MENEKKGISSIKKGKKDESSFYSNQDFDPKSTFAYPENEGLPMFRQDTPNEWRNEMIMSPQTPHYPNFS